MYWIRFVCPLYLSNFSLLITDKGGPSLFLDETHPRLLLESITLIVQRPTAFCTFNYTHPLSLTFFRKPHYSH
jgi:hypothetical protein